MRGGLVREGKCKRGKWREGKMDGEKWCNGRGSEEGGKGGKASGGESRWSRGWEVCDREVSDGEGKWGRECDGRGVREGMDRERGRERDAMNWNIYCFENACFTNDITTIVTDTRWHLQWHAWALSVRMHLPYRRQEICFIHSVGTASALHYSLHYITPFYSSIGRLGIRQTINGCFYILII